MEFAHFIASTLRRSGCLAETRTTDLVESLLTGPVAASLELPEHAVLRVRGAPGPGELPATYGSGLLAQLCALAEGGGRRHRLELAPLLPKKERVEREAQEALSFQNGVGRIESVDEEMLQYLLFDFRYTASSDERQEGLLSVSVGPTGTTCPGLAESLQGYLSSHPEARRPWSGSDDLPVDRTCRLAGRSLALARARSDAGPFIMRMQRRFQRDTRRTEDYYEALLREVSKKRHRGRGGESTLSSKLSAIESEKRRRNQDLVRRYAVTLRVEPLAVLALRVRGASLRARVQRRKNEMRVTLGWNPITRAFDRWLCHACHTGAGVPSLCDNLHILCARCPPGCPACGRSACPACSPAPCPCRRSGATRPGEPGRESRLS